MTSSRTSNLRRVEDESRFVEHKHSISVSIVTYAPNAVEIGETITSLAGALVSPEVKIAQSILYLVDNGPDEEATSVVQQLAERASATGVFSAVEVISGHGNVGYGAGHNLAILHSSSDLHLILNPDVVSKESSLAKLIIYLDRHPETSVAVPEVRNEDGSVQWTAKRYPSVAVLGIRGFAPSFIRNWFKGRVAKYEMQDVFPATKPTEIPIASGCYMLCRTAALQQVGGFNDSFFMYFEDFDLSLRLRKHGGITQIPEAVVVHGGGHAARKGLRHIRFFFASALRFFSLHGWKLW